MSSSLRMVGWIAHYTIGVVFALGFVLLTSGDWLARPTVLPALLYGIGTVVFPCLIMQPSFGLGMSGRHLGGNVGPEYLYSDRAFMPESRAR